MKLFNTLTREITEFAALNPPTATVYTCGPTVYDYAHIGHWFTYIRSDILIRTLKLNGFQTKTVMNITDVGHLVSDADEGEDKIEKGARREGKSAWEIAEFYTKDFLECMDNLDILPPDNITKATEHIADQIELIKVLEQKGFTYIISDGVYFDTKKFPRYADFAQLDIDEQQAGARVDFNPEKLSPTDFALWKFSPSAEAGKQRDMEWDSPWGKGFPGWHIECSAMSMKYLGTTIDIHTGGIDHIPVHHTNEIAQSESATGVQFVRFWLHSNHVMVEGEKIAKSIGNGVRLQEIVERGYSPQVIRLHALESHYRSQSKFSWDSLGAAKNRLQDFQALADLRWQPINPSSSQVIIKLVADNIVGHLDEDLNTPAILAEVSKLSNELHAGINQADVAELNRLIRVMKDATGIDLDKDDMDPTTKGLLEGRGRAKEAKDFDQADQLRKTLAEHGFEVKDTENGQIWLRL